MVEKASKQIAEIVHLLVDASGLIFDVIINKGSEQGVKLGDKYLVFGLGPELIDPASGESLGVLELVRGRGEIIHVQEKMSTLRSTEKRSSAGKRTIRKSTAQPANPVYFLQIPDVTEEIMTPEQIEIPFESVTKKDKAKLIV